MKLPDNFPALPDFPAGEVWLAGAGPGDPRLLTVLALHAVASADTIVHDALVDRRILDMADTSAERIFAGKRGGRPSPQQAEINAILVDRAQAGRRVLRLKGGDPFVFGRGLDEAAALTEAGIRFRVIPGITSGLAAAAVSPVSRSSAAPTTSTRPFMPWRPDDRATISTPGRWPGKRLPVSSRAMPTPRTLRSPKA